MKAIALIIVSLSFLLNGCDTSTKPSDENLPHLTSVTANGVQFMLMLERNDFNLTDTLIAEFRVINQTNSTKQFHFNNIQQHGFSLKNGSGIKVVNYPLGLRPALSSFTLQPQGSKTFPVQTVFRDDNGQIITPGNYILSAHLLDGSYPEVSLMIRIH